MRLAPESLRGRIPVRAAVVAAVLFNPAVIALSSVWGQVDAVPAAFVLGSLLLLFTRTPTLRREIAAIVLFALAFSMKPQSSFLFPVLGYALFRRHVYRRPLSEIGRGLVRIAVVGVPGAALWALSGIPFGLSPSGLEAFYSKASNGYKATSVWAFNLWGAIGFDRADVRRSQRPCSTVAGVSRRSTWVRSSFGAATAYVLWRAHRSINRGHDEARVLLAAAAMTTLLAFTVLTRMHERYLFPVFACLAPLVLWRGFRRAYVVLSVLFVLNLWYPFALYNRSWGFVTTFKYEPAFHWVFGNIDTTDTWQKKMWSLVMVAGVHRARRARLPVDRARRRHLVPDGAGADSERRECELGRVPRAWIRPVPTETGARRQRGDARGTAEADPSAGGGCVCLPLSVVVASRACSAWWCCARRRRPRTT